MEQIVIKKWSAWAPGLSSKQDWLDWASGSMQLQANDEAPDLKHLPPVSRRRLSQLSKMVLEVGHNLLAGEKKVVTIFCSHHGEIRRQHAITKGLIQSGEVSPATFSFSVFNTPVSLLSIHERSHEPAMVLLAGKNGLITGLTALLSQLNSQPDLDVLLLFSDERLPVDYQALDEDTNDPFAFGCVIGRPGPGEGLTITCSFSNDINVANNQDMHPLHFLKWLISDTLNVLRVQQNGMSLALEKHSIGRDNES